MTTSSITNNGSNPTKEKLHIYLANLVKKKFGVFLEIDHQRFDNADSKLRAITRIRAYNSLEDAKNNKNMIAAGLSHCSRGDQFVRSTGLEIALRRLYRDLSNNKK